MKTKHAFLTGLAWLGILATGLANPVITNRPASTTNAIGTTATICVGATGIEPLAYQWRHVWGGGYADLPGATNACLVLPNVQPWITTNNYRVQVCDIEGCVTSTLSAKVWVVVPPFISQQPSNQTVHVGSNYTSRVVVSNQVGVLSYQWFFNGNPLPGQTRSNLTILNVQNTNAGDYRVVVTNLAGTTNSDVARLRVFEAPVTFTRITTGPVATDAAHSWGCTWVDYDNDGYIDLFVSSGAVLAAGDTNRLYHNNRDGTFTRMTTNDVGSMVGQTNMWAGCAWADYDNDGWMDLLAVNAGSRQQVLYRNNGNGTFTSATNAGAIVTDRWTALTAAWGDYDRDGFIDVFVTGSGGDRNRVFRNLGDGTFASITGPFTEDIVNAEYAAWSDMDNEGNLDLVVTAPGNSRVLLYKNQGAGQWLRCTNAVTSDSIAMPQVPSWGDYDNDGSQDLFVAGWNQLSRLFHNDGNGQFSKMLMADPAETVIGAWGDCDNDGDLDLYVARGWFNADQKPLMFFNNGDGTFIQIFHGSQVNDLTRSGACAWGDYDNDGFLDLVATGYGWRPTLFYHNNGNTNHWIMMKLIGTLSNRAAIGAKVRVLATIFGRRYWQMREIPGGNGSQDDQRAHFGLGDATRVETVRVEWPSGHVTVITNIPANQILTIQEPPGVKVAGREGEALRISVTGHIGERYDVFTSTNVTADKTNWVHWQTVTNTARTIAVSAPINGTETNRFYKAEPTP